MSAGTSPSTGVGSSGFRKGTFRWTGPGGVPLAASTARASVTRSERSLRASGSGSGSVRWYRTASPYSLVWSVVWFAPLSWSSGGRSAVSAIRGTRPSLASITAGW